MSFKHYQQSLLVGTICKSFKGTLCALERAAYSTRAVAMINELKEGVGEFYGSDQVEAQALVDSKHSFEFDDYLFALLRKADSRNVDIIEKYFPFSVKEIRARFNAPGGVLCRADLEGPFAQQWMKKQGVKLENFPDLPEHIAL